MVQFFNSKFGEKLALLTEQAYNALKHHNVTVENTESKEMSRIHQLDERLKQILADQSLPSDKKAVLYSNTLADFLHTRETAPEVQVGLPEPTRPVVKLEEVAVGPESAETVDVAVGPDRPPPMAIAVAPKTEEALLKHIEDPAHQQHASRLLAAIRSAPGVVPADNKGSLMIRGRVIRWSDLARILEYITGAQPIDIILEKRPAGTEMFLRALGHLGINPNLIPNPYLRGMMHNLKAGISGKGRVITKWQRL